MANKSARMQQEQVIDICNKRNARLALEATQKQRRIDRAAKAQDKLAAQIAKAEAKLQKEKQKI
jgi:hypothetical protein